MNNIKSTCYIIGNNAVMAELQKKKAFTTGKNATTNKIYGVYMRSILNQKVSLSITEIGQNLRQILEQKLVQANENKCIREGFVKPNSVSIIQYSSGLVNAEWIVFETVFECMICHPVEGMLIECIVKTITKAGIHAEVIDNTTVPVVVFVARDHHNINKKFNSTVENQKILVKVIGSRFELNDSHISVIAQLLEEQDAEKEDKKMRQKMNGGLAKLTVYDDDNVEDTWENNIMPDKSDSDKSDSEDE